MYVLESDVPTLTLLPLDNWLNKYGPRTQFVWRKVLRPGGADARVRVSGLDHGVLEGVLQDLGPRSYPSLWQTVVRRGTPPCLTTRLPDSGASNCVEVACHVLRTTGLLGPEVDTRTWGPDRLTSHWWGDRDVAREILLLPSPQSREQRVEQDEGGPEDPLGAVGGGAAGLTVDQARPGRRPHPPLPPCGHRPGEIQVTNQTGRVRTM